jgi:cell shape-determining protein MreC
MVLLKDRSAKVNVGDWVASRLAVQAGAQQGVRDDLRVLGRETLIGWIEFTAPYLSRAVLLSDKFSNRVWRVHVAARRPGQKSYDYVRHLEDLARYAEFPLEGMGEGKMLMAEVEARYISEGRIQVGDVVTTDGHDPKLPVAMVIGDIVELQQIKKKPLLYNVIVKHRCDPQDLTQVFIVDMSR